MLQRSSGTSVIASTPVLSSLQNDAGSFASPGKRQPIPIIAIGSLGVSRSDIDSDDIFPSSWLMAYQSLHMCKCIDNTLMGCPTGWEACSTDRQDDQERYAQ